MIGLPNLRCTAFWLLLLWCGHAASQPVVILRGDGHYPPDEMLVNGELSGFHIEVIRAVARQLALEIRFESVPWARAQYMLKNGQGDALSFLAHNKERAQYAVFLPGNILSSIDHYLVYHPDHPPARLRVHWRSCTIIASAFAMVTVMARYLMMPGKSSKSWFRTINTCSTCCAMAVSTWRS